MGGSVGGEYFYWVSERGREGEGGRLGKGVNVNEGEIGYLVGVGKESQAIPRVTKGHGVGVGAEGGYTFSGPPSLSPTTTTPPPQPFLAHLPWGDLVYNPSPAQALMSLLWVFCSGEYVQEYDKKRERS